jgi:hypothetical protein
MRLLARNYRGFVVGAEFTRVLIMSTTSWQTIAVAF